MTDQTVNANVANCLRSVSDFGVTHVMNICNGTTTDVPWGGVDWFFCIGLSLFGLAFVAVLLSVAAAFIRDAF